MLDMLYRCSCGQRSPIETGVECALLSGGRPYCSQSEPKGRWMDNNAQQFPCQLP